VATGAVEWDTGLMSERPTYRPGEQPYDRLNGIRIGALAGGIAGAIPAAILQGWFAVLIAVGAVVGAVLGGRWAARERPE